MREIKFRAWNKRSLIMEFFDFLGIVAKGEGIGWRSLRPLYKTTVEDLTLMQYTGLKDKNGKEIYEGDIVNVRVGICNGHDRMDIAKVTFRDLAWRYDFITPYDEIDCYAKEWHLIDKTEVIGNTCENPELLKETPHE